MKVEDKELASFGYQQRLSRSLNVWHLTAFGVNYMIPLAPAIIFGLIAVTSGGTVALPYLLAFVAMFFTANSYSFMVKCFPVAGSLYTFVSKSMSPHLGFIAGWVLLLDYALIPTVTAQSAVLYFQNYFPHISYSLLFIGYVLATGLVNLVGVKLIARVGLCLLIVGEAVLFASFIFWGHHVTVAAPNGTHSLFSLMPFHFDSVPALLTATSIAILSYLGFDAITTLAEEANSPKRDIPKAIFLSLGIGALTMFLCGYLGTLAMPNFYANLHNTHWQETALFFVSQSSAGELFTKIFTASFILSMFVFNAVATTAASRLMFGMGRDNVLPKGIFGKVNNRFKTPHFNIIFIMIVECMVGLKLSVDLVSEVINFGALLGFSLLNVSVIYFAIKNNELHFSIGNIVRYLLFPATGVFILVYILISMDKIALIFGTSWLTIGVLYGAFWSKGYQRVPQAFLGAPRG